MPTSVPATRNGGAATPETGYAVHAAVANRHAARHPVGNDPRTGRNGLGADKPNIRIKTLSLKAAITDGPRDAIQERDARQSAGRESNMRHGTQHGAPPAVRLSIGQSFWDRGNS